MDSGELSMNLALAILAPASAVRPVGGHSSQKEGERKDGSRAHPDDENCDAESDLSQSGDRSTHRLDRLA